MEQPDPIAAFRRAVELAGGQSAFAKLVGCTQGNIWQLLNKGSPLPPRFALKAETGTGVSKSDLCPDVYPRDLLPVDCDRAREMQGRAA